ncbi:MAG: hypothetical protein AVO35_07455 [Candidatus Aegiribacteria sp. MLS_C]|nr:MAG: hypothetical protein AVO35_07455 [Candidatus Aegiribacteria sp. MLS_C]
MKISRIKDWVLQLALALIIFFGFLRPYVIEAFRIPTPSMERTMLVGDHLLVLKVEEGQQIPWTDRLRPPFHGFRGGDRNLLMPGTGDPEVGEILVFKYPFGGNDFVKRLVALPGDTVRVSGDTLYVNGNPLENWSLCYQDPLEQSPLDADWPLCIDQLYGRVADLAYWDIRNACVLTPEGLLAYVVPDGHLFMMGDNRDHSSDSRVWGALPIDLVKGEALVTYWSWVPGRGLPRFDRIARLIR